MNEMPRSIKYSILIPTLNRCEYLRSSVESVLTSSREDIELIVSDNHSTDLTNSYLLTLDDPRLKLIRPQSRLPMAAHYEFALNYAVGEWVCILGDDDALIHNSFDILDSIIFRHPHVDAISSSRSYYFWPGTEDLYGDIAVDISSTQNYQQRNTRADLILSLLNLRSMHNLPTIYTVGFIRKKLYTHVKQNCEGLFFHSIIPDIYSAVAITAFTSSYIRLDFPLSIVGTSAKSFGRKDRIYEDSICSQSAETTIGPTTLTHGISQELHSLKLQGLYLYEAYLALPAKGNLPSLRYMSAITCTSLLADVFTRPLRFWPFLFANIRAQFAQYGTSTLSCIPFAILLASIRFTMHLLRKSHRVVTLLLPSNPSTFHFKSRDKSLFPSIRHVTDLYCSKVSPFSPFND